MLSKGLRDEEQERINTAFNAILMWDFVPDLWLIKHRNQLNENFAEVLGFTFDELETIVETDLLQQLKSKHFELSHYEQLGDILLKSIPLEAKEKQLGLAKKTVLIYETAQEESKTFSFGLIQKIENAKAWLQ